MNMMIDIDNTLEDFFSAAIPMLNHIFKMDISLQEAHQHYDLSNLYGIPEDNLERLLFTLAQEIYAPPPLFLPGAVEFLEYALEAGVQVELCTHRNTFAYSVAQSFYFTKWGLLVHQMNPQERYEYCRLIGADILMDDSPAILSKWLTTPTDTQLWLLAYPYNSNHPHRRNIRRFANLADAAYALANCLQ